MKGGKPMEKETVFLADFLALFEKLPPAKQREIKTAMEWYLDGKRAAEAEAQKGA